ncbi:OmpA family protein [bacterium]|nr:OmpA family protein [bacterium]
MLVKIRCLVYVVMCLPLLAKAQYNRGGDGPLIYKVFFDTSDFNLDERDKKILSTLAEVIKEKPGILFEVSGHTDTLGSNEFNQQLSLQRANEVKKYLVSNGVDERCLYVVGYGETKPFKHMGRYSDKFSRRVEFRQILRVAGRLYDAQSKAPLSGKVLLNVPNKPMMNEELLTDAKGNFEFITTYRSKYYFFAFAEGYLSSSDSISADMKTVGASNVYLQLPMQKATVAERINFDNIYFFEAQFKVMPKSEPSIQKIVDLLNANPEVYVEIRGHVNQPDRENLSKEVIEDGYKLSFARARAVYNELVRHGISPSRIKYRGMGGDEMLYENPQTEEEHEANRRVEILILKLK